MLGYFGSGCAHNSANFFPLMYLPSALGASFGLTSEHEHIPTFTSYLFVSYGNVNTQFGKLSSLAPFKSRQGQFEQGGGTWVHYLTAGSIIGPHLLWSAPSLGSKSPHGDFSQGKGAH